MVRSFVGGLELILGLLKSNNPEVRSLGAGERERRKKECTARWMDEWMNE